MKKIINARSPEIIIIIKLSAVLLVQNCLSYVNGKSWSIIYDL